MIEIQQSIPLMDVYVLSNGQEATTVSTQTIFADKNTIFIGVPGAFTPICSSSHLPGLIETRQDFYRQGIDQIVCVSVNDPFVMSAWVQTLKAPQEIIWIADWNAAFVRMLGLTFNGDPYGLGERSQRFAMVVENLIVQKIWVESKPGTCDVTSAHSVLSSL